MASRAWPLGRRRIPPLGLALAGGGGLAVALVAGRWPLAPLWLAAGLLVLAGSAVAGRFPGQALAGLLALVLLQDPMVAAGLTPLQMADEAMVILAMAGLAWQALRCGRLVRTPLDLPSLGFLLAALLSAAVRQVPAWIAALGVLSLAKGLAVFHLAARLPDPRRAARRGLPWLLGLTAASAAVALVQRLGGAGVYRLMGRLDYHQQWQGTKAPSIFFNHNSLGHVMVLAGLPLLALALSPPALASLGRATRPVRMAALLCLGGLVVSASREAWLAAMAGLLILAVLGRSRRHWVLALAVCLVLALGGLGVYAGSALLRAEIARRTAGVWEGWRLYQMGYSGWSYRGEYRVYNILKSWEIFLDQPLLGTGPGRFGGATAVRYPSPVYAAYDFLPLNGAYIPLDVFWSRLLTEFGLLGAAAYLSCLAAYGRLAWRLARAPDPLGRATGLAAAMALAAVLVLGVFSPALEDPLSSMPFWALGGLTWALGRASRTDISAIADDAAGSEPNAVGGGPDEGPDLAFGTGP